VLIEAFMQAIVIGQSSYLAWARELSKVIGCKISKQAIFYRMNECWVETVKTLVGEVVLQQAGKQIKHSLFKGFKNVWLQDSTCMNLPQALIGKFSGGVANGKQNTTAKLNVIVNALSGLCPLMEWGSFTDSEQSLCSNILGIAKKGDLVLRDLGYFVLSAFRKMDEDGIFFLSRWKNKVILYNAQTEKEIDLTKLLKGKAYLDIPVLCGRDEMVKVRLVAMKLSPAQAAERIRKAKRDGKKKTNHDERYYALLGYVIFITNVSDDIWNYKQVAIAYRVRWNIEILFKSWKSGLNIEQMIPEAQIHTERVEGVLYLLLLYIAWFQLLVYAPLRWVLHEKGKCLSIIKAAKWLIANTDRWMNGEITLAMKREISYYCCYESRLRTNATERLELFFKELP
jgi:hypothetical protein